LRAKLNEVSLGIDDSFLVGVTVSQPSFMDENTPPDELMTLGNAQIKDQFDSLSCRTKKIRRFKTSSSIEVR